MLEKTVIQKHQDLDNIRLFTRYVDDCLLFIRKTETQNVLDEMNNFDSMLKFTFEKPVNGELNFLDTTIFTDKNGSLQLKTYIKPSASEVKVNFRESISPMKYKISTLVTDLHRCFNTCTTDTELEKSLNTMENIYTKNGFLRRLVTGKIKRDIFSLFAKILTTLIKTKVTTINSISFYNILVHDVILSLNIHLKLLKD